MRRILMAAVLASGCPMPEPATPGAAPTCPPGAAACGPQPAEIFVRKQRLDETQSAEGFSVAASPYRVSGWDFTIRNHNDRDAIVEWRNSRFETPGGQQARLVRERHLGKRGDHPDGVVPANGVYTERIFVEQSAEMELKMEQLEGDLQAGKFGSDADKTRRFMREERLRFMRNMNGMKLRIYLTVGSEQREWIGTVVSTE